MYAAAGDDASAAAELTAAIDSVPTWTDPQLELARVERRSGRVDAAMDLLIGILHRDPYHFDALLALGETLLSADRIRDAATAFARILRFDPEHAGALFHQGVLLAKHSRYRDAISSWQQVIDLEPAGEWARRARKEMRTAAELSHIFAASDRPTPVGAR